MKFATNLLAFVLFIALGGCAAVRTPTGNQAYDACVETVDPPYGKLGSTLAGVSAVIWPWGIWEAVTSYRSDVGARDACASKL